MNGFYFQAPHFFWLGGLLLIPIILHWLNRSQRPPQLFAATHWLRQSSRMPVRRIHFSQLLLLILRLLLLAALIVQLAQPAKTVNRKDLPAIGLVSSRLTDAELSQLTARSDWQQSWPLYQLETFVETGELMPLQSEGNASSRSADKAALHPELLLHETLADFQLHVFAHRDDVVLPVQNLARLNAITWHVVNASPEQTALSMALSASQTTAAVADYRQRLIERWLPALSEATRIEFKTTTSAPQDFSALQDLQIIWRFDATPVTADERAWLAAGGVLITAQESLLTESDTEQSLLQVATETPPAWQVQRTGKGAIIEWVPGWQQLPSPPELDELWQLLSLRLDLLRKLNELWLVDSSQARETEEVSVSFSQQISLWWLIAMLFLIERIIALKAWPLFARRRMPAEERRL